MKVVVRIRRVANELSPSIGFIDEIDAVGTKEMLYGQTISSQKMVVADVLLPSLRLLLNAVVAAIVEAVAKRYAADKASAKRCAADELAATAGLIRLFKSTSAHNLFAKITLEYFSEETLIDSPTKIKHSRCSFPKKNRKACFCIYSTTNTTSVNLSYKVTSLYASSDKSGNLGVKVSSGAGLDKQAYVGIFFVCKMLTKIFFISQTYRETYS